MDDDGVDPGVVEEVLDGCFLENTAVEIALALDLLFGKKKGNRAAGHDGVGEGAGGEDGVFLLAQVADRNGKFGVGAVFDVLNREFFLEEIDHVFPAQEPGGLAENEHGDPTIEEAGIKKGALEAG